jgi:hypothetical protein
METAIRELTEAINQMNSGIDWASAISAVCSVVSLIAIVVLLVERKEKQRPYLQISFELVKSSLVCLVIRNVGTTPAKLQEISFNEDFVKQLPDKAATHSRDRKNMNISIYPQNQWVLCLDVITPTVLSYENTKLEITYVYSAKGKKKKYKECEIVEFKDYSGFLVYISEMDEMRGEIKKLGSTLEKVNRNLSKMPYIFPDTVQNESYADLSDSVVKHVTVDEKTVLKTPDDKNI